MAWIVVALAGSAFLFVPGLLEQFESPKIELVRACGLGALAFGLIAGRAGGPRRWTMLDRAVVAWLAVEIAATFFSGSPRVSLVGETRQREGLLTSLALVGLYFAGREAFARPGRMRLALDLALAFVAAIGLYALVQAAGMDPLAWRREAFFEGVTMRPFATLGHPNLLGVVAGGAASMALALAITGKGRGRWLCGAVALLLGVVTILTLSRAAWLGLLFGGSCAVALAMRARRAARFSVRGFLLGVVVVAAAAAVAALSGALMPIGHRLAELAAGGGASGGSRLEIWRSALAAWRARPLIGQGPDLFEMMFPRFQTAAYWRLEWSGLPFHAHSIYLHTLATRGVIGLAAGLAWAGALATTAVVAWRRRGEGAPAGLLPAAIGFLASTAVAGAFGALGIMGALLLVLVSAMVATAAEGLIREPAPWAARETRRKPRVAAAASQRTPKSRPTARAWAARLAATALSAAAALYGFSELRASRAASAAQAFMTAAPQRAVDASRYAVSIEPFDDRLWRMHAESLLWLTTLPEAPLGTLAEAETAARRAVSLAPARAENHVILARALAAREAGGDSSARASAEEEFHTSLSLAPMDGLTLMELADHESMLGRAAPALAAAGRAARLYPGEGAAHAAMARAWLAAREPDSAQVALERAMSGVWRDAGERQAAQQMLDDLSARLVPTHAPR